MTDLPPPAIVQPYKMQGTPASAPKFDSAITGNRNVFDYSPRTNITTYAPSTNLYIGGGCPVTIMASGKVILKCEPEPSARAFWKAVEQVAPNFCKGARDDNAK